MQIFLLLILGSSSHRWRSATVQCFVVKQMKEFPRIKEGNVNKRETDTKNERGRPGGMAVNRRLSAGTCHR